MKIGQYRYKCLKCGKPCDVCSSRKSRKIKGKKKRGYRDRGRVSITLPRGWEWANQPILRVGSKVVLEIDGKRYVLRPVEGGIE